MDRAAAEMSPLEAHLALMQTLPVRTIAAKPRDQVQKGFTREQIRELSSKIQKLDAKGKRPTEIAAELGIARRTVWKHLSGRVVVLRGEK